MTKTTVKQIGIKLEDHDNNERHRNIDLNMIKKEPRHAVDAKGSQVCTQKDPPVVEVQVKYPHHDDDMDEESFVDDEGKDEDSNDDDHDDDDNEVQQPDSKGQMTEDSSTGEHDPHSLNFDKYLTFCKVLQPNGDVGYMSHHGEFFRCDV